jgi:hypothetical protein
VNKSVLRFFRGSRGRGIEANFLAANPALLGTRLSKLHVSMWRWCLTNAIHSYDATVRQYKKFTLHILPYCNKVPRDEENPMPYGIPGNKSGSLGPDWFELLPALKHFAFAKILGDMSMIQASAFKSIGYIIQTRMTPPPPLTPQRVEKEYLDLKEQFMSRIEYSVAQRHETERIATRLGNFIAKAETNQRPHISLVASGCYESPRAQGGRGFYIAGVFIQEYVRNLASESYEGKTLWGAPLVLIERRRPYQTLCRTSSLREEIPFLRSAFRDEMGPNGLITAVLGGVNAHLSLEGPVLGLDAALPHQILQLAHEKCVANGWLQGPAEFTLKREPDFHW